MPCLCPFSQQARNRTANISRHKFPPCKEPALHEPFCMSSNHNCPIARHITSQQPIEQVFRAIQRQNSPFRKISCQHESQLCIANSLGRIQTIRRLPSSLYPLRPPVNTICPRNFLSENAICNLGIRAACRRRAKRHGFISVYRVGVQGKVRSADGQRPHGQIDLLARPEV